MKSKYPVMISSEFFTKRNDLYPGVFQLVATEADYDSFQKGGKVKTTFAYLTSHGHTYEGTESEMLGHHRRYNGDLFSDVEELAEKLVNNKGEVEIFFSNPNTEPFVMKKKDLRKRKNEVNGFDYYVYRNPHLDIYNVVRAEEGRLVTGHADKISWIY